MYYSIELLSWKDFLGDLPTSGSNFASPLAPGAVANKSISILKTMRKKVRKRINPDFFQAGHCQSALTK
jgi:hypothetical protein